MAMNKLYSRIHWKNYPSEDSPVNEANLNRMDGALDAIDSRVMEQDAIKLDKAEAYGLVKDWDMDQTTGLITITKYNGEKIFFDLNIEKIPVDFSLSPDGILTMTTADGAKMTADIGGMIPALTFQDSATIAASVTGTGKNKTCSFFIKEGSVTENMLEPNYLANVQTAAGTAQTAAQAADLSAAAARTSETNAGKSEAAVTAAAQAAGTSEQNAKASETAVLAAQTAAQTAKTAAETASTAAAAKATEAAASARTASEKATAATASEAAALHSAQLAAQNASAATDKATAAKSYAEGGTGTRPGEDTDNAKYYMEQAKLQTGDVPTKLSQLENDAGFLTIAVDNLINYYKASQLYTKTEIDAKLSAIPKFAIKAVTALPTSGISSTTIYLLKEQDAGTNKCSEWVYINSAWEKLGDIDVDLTGYLTKTGDGSSLTESFSQASTLANITTGEKHSTIFGKIAKAISTLISHVSTAATTSVLGHVKVDSTLTATSTNPVQNKTVKAALDGKLATSGDASDTTVTYTEAAALTELASGEKLSTAFGKLKLAVKNVKAILNLLGTTDISAIGGGTVTGAVSLLNQNLTKLFEVYYLSDAVLNNDCNYLPLNSIGYTNGSTKNTATGGGGEVILTTGISEQHKVQTSVSIVTGQHKSRGSINNVWTAWNGGIPALDFDHPVELSGYTSAGNRYTVPGNGIIIVDCYSISADNPYCMICFQQEARTAIIQENAAGLNMYTEIHCNKWDQVYFQYSNVAIRRISFIPCL